MQKYLVHCDTQSVFKPSTTPNIVSGSLVTGGVGTEGFLGYISPKCLNINLHSVLYKAYYGLHESGLLCKYGREYTHLPVGTSFSFRVLARILVPTSTYNNTHTTSPELLTSLEVPFVLGNSLSGSRVLCTPHIFQLRSLNDLLDTTQLLSTTNTFKQYR